MTTPIVAIVGLPNSGKSTFFNKILGVRKALTYPEAGTTRDRAYGITSWEGLNFYLVDTAGLVNRPKGELEINIQKQTAIAKEEADLIILCVDGSTHPSELDFNVAQTLGKSGKSIVLLVNKIDVRNQKTQKIIDEYKQLGLGQPFAVSSINGSGLGDVLDAVVSLLLKKFPKQQTEENDRIKVSFIGKPNVGKSSLINKLLKEERLLVHALAGTTRSTIEIPFSATIKKTKSGSTDLLRAKLRLSAEVFTKAEASREGGEYTEQKFSLLDTAGIKRRWKQDSDVETAAAMQSIRTLNHTDVAFFVLDASSKFTVQDQTIAGLIKEEKKNAIILLNKIDLLDAEQQQKVLDSLPYHFPDLWWAPVVFTSAKTGLNLEKVLELSFQISQASQTEIDATQLDSFLEKILKEKMPGKISDQRAPKIYNLKQVGTNPLSFKLTVNFPNAIHKSWQKYFEKQFRLKFGFLGTPIIINLAKRQ